MSSALTMTAVLLGLVIGMYWLAAVARKRLGVGAGTVTSDALRVVGKRMLEPRKALYVVEIGDRYVLVGTAENSVSLIDHITADEFERMTDPAEFNAEPANPFARLAARRRDAATDEGESEPPQRFATVGESFAQLLSRARARRTNSDAPIETPVPEKQSA